MTYRCCDHCDFMCAFRSVGHPTPCHELCIDGKLPLILATSDQEQTS